MEEFINRMEKIYQCVNFHYMNILAFDLMGVIFPNINRGSRANIKHLHSTLPNPPFTFEELYSRYDKLVRGHITEKTFWQQIDEDISTAIRTQFLDRYEFYSKTEQMITHFSKKHTCVVLSNHPAEWVNCLDAKFSFMKKFDHMFISGKTGVKKPDTQSYRNVWQYYNVQPENVTLIDDQLKNLKPAKKLGLRTVFVNVHDTAHQFVADLEIKSLDQLLHANI